MIRSILITIIALVGSVSTGHANAKPSVGIVNFTTCMSESKLGKQEQSSFESIKTQMTSLLQDTQKQIEEISAKFNDAEYMDGLSPEAEEGMKLKFRTLNEENSRYQNQYYQVLNQANMKIIQAMGTSIQEASEKVANDKKLSMVMNKEACFFCTPTLDVTNQVIAEMDRAFEQKIEQKKVANKAKAAQVK